MICKLAVLVRLEHIYVLLGRQSRVLQHTVSSVATILPRQLRALSEAPVALGDLGELGEALRGPCLRKLASHTSRAWDVEGKVSQLTSGDHQARRTSCTSSSQPSCTTSYADHRLVPHCPRCLLSWMSVAARAASSSLSVSESLCVSADIRYAYTQLPEHCQCHPCTHLSFKEPPRSTQRATSDPSSYPAERRSDKLVIGLGSSPNAMTTDCGAHRNGWLVGEHCPWPHVSVGKCGICAAGRALIDGAGWLIPVTRWRLSVSAAHAD